MPYILVFEEDGVEQRREVHEEELVAGRSPDCGLVLSQAGISRRHCRFLLKGDDVFVEDLNSKNGTRVNGVYIKNSRLASGDEILIAEFPVRYESEDSDEEHIEELGEDDFYDGQVVLSEEKDLQEEAGTIIREVNDLNDIIAHYEAKEDAASALEQSQLKVTKIMSSLVEMAKALLQVKTVEGITQKVMDIVFEHLPADRGFLMLENDRKELKPRVVKHRHGGGADQIQISKTIATKVFREGVAILTTDAQIDPRFSAGESIRFLGIKSAMCVPLSNNKKTIGLIYLDSPTSAAVFDQIDLDMLSAMGNFAAVGIEQALLQQKIQQESKVRQHLERYHSPSIVNRILKNTASAVEADSEFSLQVQERDVTILFADIVGFTPLSERLAPGRIAELLNEYFSVMTEIIFRYEGTLDKYIGDAIMAIFGAPNTMEDHPFRAVCSGVEMLEKLEELNAGPRRGRALRHSHRHQHRSRRRGRYRFRQTHGLHRTRQHRQRGLTYRVLRLQNQPGRGRRRHLRTHSKLFRL